MIKLNDNTTAIKNFEQFANKQAEAIEIGDYKTANKCYTQIVKSIVFLKEKNEIKTLRDSLFNSSVGIRLWAAFYLLPVYEQDAVSVLQTIVQSPGIHSLTAETTLNEWNKGNLKP